MKYSTMKILNRVSLFALLILISNLSYSQWNLVWQDEFNGSLSSDWVFETGTGSGGWGNNELQYYRQENASINNGHLVITARQENFGGMNYTSARLKTQGRKSWKYGKIEARISMPSFSGVWPAFWMLGDNITSVGWPACGEIDIMEQINTEQATHGTIHWQDHNGNYANYGGYTGVNVTQFHTYSIEWTDQTIRWLLDGVQYHEVNIAGGINGTSEFHNNFFIILNMAIGGNWPGFSINNGAMPAEMRIDYVRVYQAGSNPNPTAPVTLYQHCNYGGYAVGLNPGSYSVGQLQALGVANDDISSLRIQSGYQVTMYQHDGFSGNSITKYGDDACLVDDGFNDDISSLVISTGNSWSQQIEAENWAVMSGVQTEACSEGGLNAGWIDADDWMVWDVNVPSSGQYSIQYRVASASGGGNLQLENAGGSPVYGSLGVPNTGGWQNWTTISHNVNLNAGQQQIAVKALSGGWNLNWIKIVSGSGARLEMESTEDLKQESIQVFPNPSTSYLNVKGITDETNYSVVDLGGRELLSGKLSSQESQIEVNSLKSGMYLLRLEASNQTLQFIKK